MSEKSDDAAIAQTSFWEALEPKMKRLPMPEGAAGAEAQPPSLRVASREAERGCSSVGRAVALQAIGREFESPQLHQALWRAPVAQLVRACA